MRLSLSSFFGKLFPKVKHMLNFQIFENFCYAKSILRIFHEKI